ncbi:phosphatase PAP2 family protein [Microvirga sp. 2TAF3]|uniref:phosphatase PAP2 family protein n=1 Tax=Microvirga sp. 2TAF3 TaxID=3233014 RepID=UPI003F977C39
MNRSALLAVGLLALSLVPAAPSVAKDKFRLDVSIDTAQIGAPPSPTAAAQDLDGVLFSQAQWTQAREDQAIRDARQTLSSFLEGMGATVDKNELRKARRLFKDATAALEEALAPVKDRFGRPRPFKASSHVRTCPIKLPQSSSFPSTHAGTGALFAALLSHVAPERKVELEARGRDYGWSRVVCGFHYPSDIEAGRKGGLLVADVLLHDAAFVKRLDNVAPELRKALGP